MSSSSVEDWPEWKCKICKEKAMDSNQLDMLMITNETVILKDADGKEWLRCVHCDKRYHLTCVKNLPEEVEECDFQFEIYVCYDCGWSMQGAPHSETD